MGGGRWDHGPFRVKRGCSSGRLGRTLVGVIDAARLLAAYDSQLRCEAETPGAVSVTRQGPLLLATLEGGRGFITYRDLGGAGLDAIGRVVSEALAHFTADAAIGEVEWKTRGHDHAPGLHEALLENGFVPDEPESIMLGEARALAVDVALPDGVTLRRVTEEADIRAMTAMQEEVFGDPHSDERPNAVLRRLARGDEIELWVAEADGDIVSAGRLEAVAGTEFAGIWGGATRPAWRGRGIYRALTAERARSALRLGKTYINSDSTEYSRPILERSGFVKVSTTTPYNWRRASGDGSG
jgi:Acetyltransferase (GNAT) domain